MSFGILGQLSTESATLTGTQHDVVDDVVADAAYMEAAELTHDAEMHAVALEQAVVVADKLEEQIEGLTSIAANPEMVTPATVVVANEAMALAKVALGDKSEDFQVSREALETNPLQALEVTTEGLKDTAKKIYEAIKQVFVKIGQSIKKLAAKVVIAVTNIDKKAQSLYDKYKDKKLQLVEDVDGSLLYDAMKPSLGLVYVVNKLGAAGMSPRDIMDVFANNVKAYVGFEESFIKMIDSIEETAQKALEAKEGKTEEEVLKEHLAELAKAAKDFEAVVNGMTTMEIPTSMLPDENAEKYKFAPTYIKGSKVGGIVIYMDPEVELKSFDDARNAIVVKSHVVDVEEDEAFVKGLQNEKVPDAKEILNELKSGFKGANKVVKAIADDRQRDLDRLSKQIDKEAARKKGLKMLNKLKATRFNKVRTIAAGHFINQIFSGVNLYKGRLASDAKILKTFYEEK